MTLEGLVTSFSDFLKQVAQRHNAPLRINAIWQNDHLAVSWDQAPLAGEEKVSLEQMLKDVIPRIPEFAHVIISDNMIVIEFTLVNIELDSMMLSLVHRFDGSVIQ